MPKNTYVDIIDNFMANLKIFLCHFTKRWDIKLVVKSALDM